MQIGFTKRGCAGAGQPGIKLHHPAMPCAWATGNHIRPNKRLLYTNAPVKKLNRKIETEKETKKRNRQKEEEEKKRSIPSILTRAAMYIQSACSFPQFPAGFSKGTQILEKKKKEKIGKIKLYIDSCLFFFCATTAAPSTRSRPNRQTETTLCPILLKTNFTRSSKAGPSRFPTVRADNSQGLRRDLLQVVHIICQKINKMRPRSNTTNPSIVILDVFIAIQ